MDIEGIVGITLFLLVVVHFKYMCLTTRTDKHFSYCETLLTNTSEPPVMKRSELGSRVDDKRIINAVNKMCCHDGSEKCQTATFTTYGTDGSKYTVSCNNEHLALIKT